MTLQTRHCNDVISTSGISFGTSGARGLVEDFTPEVCAAYTTSLIRVLQENYQFTQILIGIDNRPSSPDIASYCAAAAMAIDIEPFYCGVLPTPALALYAMKKNIPCIMVTGSHIPFDRNGLKFYTPDGEISKADELAIAECNDSLEKPKTYQLADADQTAINHYIQRHTSLFEGQPLANKKIGIYEHSSAGRDIYGEILKSLGAEVISIGRSDEFVPIDTEAVSQEDVERAKTWAKEYNLDAIFSTDGDGDRPLIADQHGTWFRGDIVGLLTCKYLRMEAIATPVSCNTAIEASGLAKTVVRTKIGSPYVLAEFEQLKKTHKTVAGFEANGGFMLGSNCEFNGSTLAPLPTRDALLPFLVLLAAAIEENSSMSELLASLPERYTASDRLTEIPREKSLELLEEIRQQPDKFLDSLGISTKLQSLNETDGMRLILEDGSIVHLRPSGNAPELRIYVECGEKSLTFKFLEDVKVKLVELFD